MPAPLKTGKLAIDRAARRAAVDNQPLRLSDREYAVLELLILHWGYVVTKEMLLEHLYREEGAGKVTTLRMFVRNLRKKLAQATGREDLIETVGGRGYRLPDKVE